MYHDQQEDLHAQLDPQAKMYTDWDYQMDSMYLFLAILMKNETTCKFLLSVAMF